MSLHACFSGFSDCFTNTWSFINAYEYVVSYYCVDVNYNSNGICIKSLNKLGYLTILTKLNSSNPWSWDAALVHLTRIFFLKSRLFYLNWICTFGWSFSMLVWISLILLFGGTEMGKPVLFMLPHPVLSLDLQSIGMRCRHHLTWHLSCLQFCKMLCGHENITFIYL